MIFLTKLLIFTCSKIVSLFTSLNKLLQSCSGSVADTYKIPKYLFIVTLNSTLTINHVITKDFMSRSIKNVTSITRRRKRAKKVKMQCFQHNLKYF